jgi:two-component system chemotaxis sensor kinase CheA
MSRDELAARLLATFVGELDEQLRAWNAELLAFESSPAEGARLNALFRIAHTLKGAARAAGVSLVEQVCNRLETLLAGARDGRVALGRAEFDLLFAAGDALADAGARLRGGEDLGGSSLAQFLETLGRAGKTRNAAPAPAAAAPLSAPRARADGFVRVPEAKLEDLLASGGDLLVNTGRIQTRAAELQAVLETASRAAEQWRQVRRRIGLVLEHAGAPRAAVQALSGIEDSFRRLVQDLGRLARAGAEDARAMARGAEAVLQQLRLLRMRPFTEVFEALPRTVRDLAATTGKEVELHVSGAEVEADRALLDGLREAVLHLVRNAVDHGIEPPRDRARAGKAPRGRVAVTAALRGDRIVVTVSDDGAGLNLPVIRERLERRGIVVPAGDAELVQSLFETGVSTREEVTAISGRGIGLDIVRVALARLRGTVDVSWEPGRGTAFTLQCPPSLASLRVVLVAVGPHVLAVPTAHVERLLRVRPDAIRQVEGRSVIPTAEAPVPVAALARLLPPLVERPIAGPTALVQLRAGERRLAVVVDELLAEQEVVLRPVERHGSEPLPHVSGAALLATGQIALVLNPVTLLAAGLTADAGAGVTLGEAPRREPAKRRLLVVDDSITTRTLEQSILEAAGYEVLTAVDGSDGWRVLQERGAHLVVADVEMPRMDGFALCEAIRASKRFKDLPVILVTAMETPEHRARGLEVGADAYIGKSGFDQQNLLETIRQLLGGEAIPAAASGRGAGTEGGR